ncbi:MAG: hypothetical protein K1X92_18560 [Bacteroidia bacterium]|nr:hypothetical protein [Bacteroidia bacterium]
MNKFKLSNLLYLMLFTVLFGACKKESSEESDTAASKTETTTTATSGKSAKERIAKKWHVENVELEAGELKGVPEEAMALAKQMYSQMVMDFRPDGTGSMSFPGMETQAGKWTISDDGKILNIINVKNGQQEPATIEKLTETELVLTIIADSKPVKLFLKL